MTLRARARRAAWAVRAAWQVTWPARLAAAVGFGAWYLIWGMPADPDPQVLFYWSGLLSELFGGPWDAGEGIPVVPKDVLIALGCFLLALPGSEEARYEWRRWRNLKSEMRRLSRETS